VFYTADVNVDRHRPSHSPCRGGRPGPAGTEAAEEASRDCANIDRPVLPSVRRETEDSDSTDQERNIRQDMNFTRLKAFYSVARHKSFTLAAREMNVSQSTLSLHVQQLERQYDIPLIKRGKNSFNLTEEGKLAFTYAKKIFSLADELNIKLEEKGSPSSGIIRIGCAPSIAQYIVPKIVLSLKEKNPGLELQINTDIAREILKKVLNYECHVGMIGRIAYPDNIIYKQILKPRFHFITSDPKMNDQIRLTDLANYPLVLPERWSVTREYIVNEFHRRNIPLGDCIHCENVSAIKQMVHLGLGGSFFPYYAIEEDVKEGKYRNIEILDDLFLNIDLIYLAKRRKSNTLKSFISTLKNLFLP
jgi:DNA-binding transcriptional LysR family regulator